MLVLSRKVGERILIGEDVEIMVCSIRGNRVKIGIGAPGEVPIVREELVAARPDGLKQAVADGCDAIKSAASC